MIRVSHLHPVLPVLLGTCLGITLNMMFAPFLDDICDPSVVSEQDTENLIKLRETMSVDEKKPVGDKEVGVMNDVRQDNLLPVTPEPPKKPKQKYKKFVRPRFASTELGIREKLFVAVMTSPNTINSFGVAVNKTMAHYVTKTMFFSNSKPGNTPTGMSVVNFADHHVKHLPIHILKYILDHYAQSFDYYMFMTDRTYIRGEKIFELASHISVSQNVYMGSPDLQNDEVNTCSIEGGIIISQSVMAKVLSQLDWCLKNAHSSNPSSTFSRCVNHAVDMPCVENVGDKIYKHYKVDDFDYDDDIEALRGDLRFNASLSIYPMPDDISHYKIHRYYCQLELNLTRQEIEKAKENIVHLSQFAPGGRDSLTWPIGVPEGVRPVSRFDVVRWTYFTETHMYFEDDFSNVRKLQGVDKEDIQEILQTAFEKMNRQYGYIFSQSRLINGYRRFEPTRGMEYILDLEFHKKNRRDLVIKRVHMIRPLGKVEIVPMPYVTENTQVNLIVPLYEEDIEEFPKFMDSYFRNVIERNDNTNLYIMFIYNNFNKKGKKDLFAFAKTTIEFYMRKTNGNGGKITWKTYQSYNKSVTMFDFMDRVSKDLQPDSLIVLGTSGMEVESDYLNRVRMNTIREVQVFFPISFWQYKQNLAYDKAPFPSDIEIGQKYGHFDVRSYEHGSFYLSDYMLARRQLALKDLMAGSVYDMFIRYKKLNIFRAAEPALRHRWRKLTCSPDMNEDQIEECLQRNAEGLASRSQMARLIFEYQETDYRGRNKNKQKIPK